ncbi:hypothetical protein AQJ58_35525 [Streptomyces sp. DSM 15324]|nr:hypothetical protein AQJ58_35525 [Streptomyces sp. DSM 15324]
MRARQPWWTEAAAQAGRGDIPAGELAGRDGEPGPRAHRRTAAAAAVRPPPESHLLRQRPGPHGGTAAHRMLGESDVVAHGRTRQQVAGWQKHSWPGGIRRLPWETEQVGGV